MKKQFYAFVVGMACVSLLAFTYNQPPYTVRNSTCEAKTAESFLIFVDAIPVKKYRVIGIITSEELPESKSTQYSTMRDKFIQKASEQYSGEADGLIFKFCDGCTDKVTVIKFD